jgi:hypothetical protein
MSTPDFASMSAAERQRYKRRQMQADPRMFLRYQWSHPNEPSRGYDFKTNDGETLKYLVDERGPFNPTEWGNINILLMARGCLKSTSMIGISQWVVDTYPQAEVFLTAPRQSQVAEFMGKFRDLLVDTSLEGRIAKDRQSHQKFENHVQTDDGDTTTSFSHVKAQSSWESDESMRGPHSHLGIIDEFQDVDENALTMMLEVIDQKINGAPQFPALFLIGTPKLKNTFFHQQWQNSNQRTWDGDDKEWIDESAVGEYAPPGFEGDAFTVKSWKIDQYNCPLHDPAAIAFKKEAYTDKKFENEVLANFYSPEDDLLSEHHIRDAFDGSQGFRNSRQLGPSGSTVVVTADWGGGSGEDASDTVFTAGEVMDVGDGPRDWECTLLRTKFIDHDVTGNQELDELRTWISRYNPDHVLVDEGHAGPRRETLQDEYGDLVHGVYFGNTRPAEDVRWNEDEQDRRCFATVNKSYVAETFVDTFKDGKFVIPTKSIDEQATDRHGWAYNFISQMTAPYKDYATSRNGTKSLKVMSDRNDDAFDTFVLLWCGIEHIHGGPQLAQLGMNSMAGY